MKTKNTIIATTAVETLEVMRARERNIKELEKQIASLKLGFSTVMQEMALTNIVNYAYQLECIDGENKIDKLL